MSAADEQEPVQLRYTRLQSGRQKVVEPVREPASTSLSVHSPSKPAPASISTRMLELAGLSETQNAVVHTGSELVGRSEGQIVAYTDSELVGSSEAPSAVEHTDSLSRGPPGLLCRLAAMVEVQTSSEPVRSQAAVAADGPLALGMPASVRKGQSEKVVAAVAGTVRATAGSYCSVATTDEASSL